MPIPAQRGCDLHELRAGVSGAGRVPGLEAHDVEQCAEWLSRMLNNQFRHADLAQLERVRVAPVRIRLIVRVLAKHGIAGLTAVVDADLDLDLGLRVRDYRSARWSHAPKYMSEVESG